MNEDSDAPRLADPPKGGTSEEPNAASGGPALVSALAHTMLIEHIPSPEIVENQRPFRSFQQGDKIDRFIVVKHLGNGAMGSVFSAYDPDLDRKIAIKVMRADSPTGGPGSEGEQRLLREAQAMAKLSHPNVVTIHQVGVVDGRVFLAMEFIDGMTLGAWLAAEKRRWRQVVDVFLQAGRGLEAAHNAGIVHRDFKPDNLLVRNDGRLSVLDFGLASAGPSAILEGRYSATDALRPSDDNSVLYSNLTQAGAIVGTPLYMAPEQADGHADARSDQFSFCVALYEALYGQCPFEGTSFIVLMRNEQEGKVRPAPAGCDVPGWLQAIVYKGLRPSPADRFPSMADLLAAISKGQRSRLGLRASYVIAGAVVLSTILGIVVFREREDHHCRGPDFELNDIWGRPQKEAIRRAFLKTGRPHASLSSEKVGQALDEYSQNWTGMRREACEATFDRQQQTERVLDLRTGCLVRRRRQFSTLVELLLDNPSPDSVDQALNAVGSLTPIAVCADIEALSSAVPPPEDPGLRIKVEGLRQRLDEVQILTNTAHYKQAVAQAEAVQAEADSLPYTPVRAEAYYRLGTVQREAGSAALALASLDHAAQLAAESKQDKLLAAAWIGSVSITGIELDRAVAALALNLDFAPPPQGKKNEAGRFRLLYETRHVCNISSVFPS